MKRIPLFIAHLLRQQIVEILSASPRACRGSIFFPRTFTSSTCPEILPFTARIANRNGTDYRMSDMTDRLHIQNIVLMNQATDTKSLE